jgi:hypothetical protein
MLLRSMRSARTSGARVLRSGAVRNMCTAVAEAEAKVGPFSPTLPHNQMFYTMAGVVYLFSLKWQSEDRKLAAFVAEHKAAHPPAEHHDDHAHAEEPAVAAHSPVVAAVAAAAPSSAPVVSWKVSDVVAFLDTLELGMHAEAFKTHSVNGKMLLTLSEQDLYQTLNIVSPLHRKKLLMEIATLRKAYLNP